ncbi:hypothetical protein CesoFtcFv8_004773 [Champsocephalus esox]|uniref:Sushi domain-containing protein n=1 Tax=Champsocephalus esox TaxID=159716 RepID=A0AAN8CN99_9TELE|nr:hypothetical protein CesoFtcFv8_004773 [Champsocephalus esox]
MPRGYVQQTNGWHPNPLCEEKRCKKPHIDDANFIGVVSESYRQNEHIQYACKNNVTVTLTCEENGWNGIQSCSACSNVKVPNGFVVPYKDTLYYTCEEGYKLPTKGWWAEAKCNDIVSSELQPCIENTKCGDLIIPNAKVTVALPGESAQVNCKEGYSTKVSHFSCRDGKWDSNGVPLKLICTPIAKPCSPPRKVQNAVLVTPYQGEYLSNSTVTYKCRESYTAAVGETTIRCMTGQWGETVIMCTPPAQ